MEIVRRLAVLSASVVALSFALGYGLGWLPDSSSQLQCASDGTLEGEAHLSGGTFFMGTDRPIQTDDAPLRQVHVGPFSIDRTEVTNRAFAEFVSATGYITMAERPLDPSLYPGLAKEDLAPSSLVFNPAGDSPGWKVVKGASWRHPEGVNSNISKRMDHPVVQIALADALAYAQWRGRDLPTEAEWEYAARSGLDQKTYEWGDEPPPAGEDLPANFWQGRFPYVNTLADGYQGTAPAGCFAANTYGLHDMSGNVWEWTKTPLEHGQDGPSHTLKGGSFLCADNYCHRYRPAARQAGPADTGASHIGFRTVKRT